MNFNLYLKVFFKRKDLLFLLGYSVILIILGTGQTSSIYFLRGFSFMEGTSSDIARQYILYSFWCIKLLIPIFYLLVELIEYFACSQYYFIRVNQRSKWLMFFFVKGMVVLVLAFMIQTTIYKIIYHIFIPFSFRMMAVFIRDCLYYFFIFQCFILCQFMIKKGLSYILPTVLFLFVFTLGNAMMLSAFHSIELMIYLIMNGIVYSINIYCINKRFSHLIQNIT